MIKRILVPLDGSEYAARAMPLAARIARSTGAHVVLTRVFDNRTAYLPVYGVVPIQRAAIDAQDDAWRNYLVEQARQPVFDGISVTTDLLTGPVAATLLSVIETEQIDLVVMNSHGRGGMERWLLGSVAEHLVHHATVPLLILREPSEAASDTSVASSTAWEALVGMDGSALAEEALMPTAELVLTLSGSTRGHLRLIRVERPVSEAEDLEPVLGSPAERLAAHAQVLRQAAADLEAVAQRLRTHYATLDITAAVVEHRDPAAALSDLAQQLANQSAGASHVLLGIATHGRGAVARWTLGSVAYRVLEGSNVPLLVVRPQGIAQQQRTTRERILQSSPLRRTAPIRQPQSPANHR